MNTEPTSFHSYPSIFALGHRHLADLFSDPVICQEKVDGSQISFGVFNDSDDTRTLRIRSKGADINVLAPEGMFASGVEVIKTLPLHPGWTYRGEFLRRPKHNALCYDRIPKNHIILFDINTGHEEYMPYAGVVAEADRLGFEVVPLLHEGMIENVDQIRAMLDKTSILGGQKIEGVVVKNYLRFGPDKKALMGKHVSEAFKEVHSAEWKAANPSKLDVVQRLIETLKTPARWNKAVLHLRERGMIEDSPRDIGHLIKEAQQDIERECMDMIAQKLTEWALPQIRRGVVRGLPEWYKDELLKRQFTQAGGATGSASESDSEGSPFESGPACQNSTGEQP